MYLEQMKRRIRNSFHSMNRIYDDDNFRNPWNIDSFVDVVSNKEEFSFGRGNFHHIV